MNNSYFKVPLSEIAARIAILRDKLKIANVDAALLFSIPELYYYSGFGGDGVIYIPVKGNPVHLVKRNVSLAKQFSRIPNVKIYGQQSKLFKTLEIEESAQIAIEKNVLTDSFVSFLQAKAKNITLIDDNSIFRQIRSIKSNFEIKLIQTAANLVDKSFEYCTEIATPEMTEIELSSRLDSWMLERGHNGHITTRAFNAALLNYSYVISSGSSTLNIHFTPISGGGLSLKYPYGPSRQKLGKNNPFFVDTCGNYQGYISDTTRTFVCGRFDSETRDQIESLRQIKRFLQENLKPKTNLAQLFDEVMDLSKELNIYDNFMGDISDKSAFLGHGVGLELDELPVFYKKGSNLAAGNVIACEPKFFIKGKKVLGIEDTFEVTKKGNKLLSKAPDCFEI
ncbi:MAG: M24 family metallopeptidase [Candidatus Hodarchaeales archaeon]|jgi:Xaa-Pro aminopeptidase